jgi:hypothetical protein
MLDIIYHGDITHTKTRYVQASFTSHNYRYLYMTYRDITSTKLDLYKLLVYNLWLHVLDMSVMETLLVQGLDLYKPLFYL